MSIGSVIRQLRHEHDMTQEQLADFLGLTSAAVSGWECDRNAPDVSLIPRLCAIFGVSADVLFGIDPANQEKKIDGIMERAERCGIREKIETYREGLAEFPSSYFLMFQLADSLAYAGEPETYENRRKERIALLEAVRAGSRDPYLKNSAEGTLCMIYLEKGMRDEALRIAESVPDLPYPHSKLMRMLAQGMDKVHEVHHKIQCEFADLCDDIRDFAALTVDGKPFLPPADAILILEKIPAFFAVFYEDGDYRGGNQDLCRVFIRMAERWADLGDEENTFGCLRSAWECAKAADDYFSGFGPGAYGISDVWDYPQMPEDKRHTSILARPSLDYPTSTFWFGNGSVEEEWGESDYVRRVVRQERFDFLRDRIDALFETE